MGAIIMSNGFFAIKQALNQIYKQKIDRTVRWTEDTLFCKKRGCVCEGCYLSKYPCRLKARVVELVRLIGAPPQLQEPTFIEDTAQEARHLLEKYNKGQVCEILEISRNTLNKILEKGA